MNLREFLKIYVSIVSVLAVALFVWHSSVSAQAPAAAKDVPTLTEVQTMSLDKAVLEFENIQLRIQALQNDLQKKQVEVQALVKTLEKPGYVLQRDAAGKWVYVIAPPPAKAEPEKK